MFPFPSPQCAGGRLQFTTWNPTDKTNITLSNGNLTAMESGGAGGVRGTTSKASGKWGLSFTLSGGTNLCVGIANTTEALALPSGNSNSLSWFPNNLRVGVTNIGAETATVNGSALIDLVCDFGAKLAWLRIDGGNWNNSGTADPATATGGYSFATLAAGPYYPFLGVSVNLLGATLDPYTRTYPSGFVPWDMV